MRRKDKLHYINAVKYLRTRPLHASQTEVETSADSSVFAYYIAPTREFYRAVLAYHSDIEIISPEELRDNFFEYIERIVERYTDYKFDD